MRDKYILIASTPADGGKKGDFMNRYSLVTIMGMIGGLLGLFIGLFLFNEYGLIEYIAIILLCALFGGAFAGVGSYLNSKGYLVNIFQTIDLIVGFFLFYLLFAMIIAMITLSFELDNRYNNYIIGLTPIPFAIYMIIRHIKKKNIKLNKKYEDESGNIYDDHIQ